MPEGRADVERARLRAGVRRPGLPRPGRRPARGRRLGGDERIAFPAVLGIKDPHGVWTALEPALGRRVFEVPDAAAVRARACASSRVLREALRRAGGTLRLNNVVVGAERDGRPRCRRCACAWACARSAMRRTGSCSPRAASRAAALELDSHWEAREVALGLDVAGDAGGGRAALHARLLRRAADEPRGRRGRRRAAARSTRTASGRSRTCWWRARRSRARRRGRRSRATASRSRRASAPRSSSSPRAARRRA